MGTNLLDYFITFCVIAALLTAGFSWWVLLVLAYGMWNYCDGMRRMDSIWKRRTRY